MFKKLFKNTIKEKQQKALEKEALRVIKFREKEASLTVDYSKAITASNFVTKFNNPFVGPIGFGSIGVGSNNISIGSDEAQQAPPDAKDDEVVEEFHKFYKFKRFHAKFSKIGLVDIEFTDKNGRVLKLQYGINDKVHNLTLGHCYVVSKSGSKILNVTYDSTDKKKVDIG